EVSFERTYICEDLSKCLCFYDSPDEAAVKRAREVVGAPIDSLTSIENIHP
ncbi:MAG: nickel-binding protein, partial [Microcystis sp.]